MDKKLERIAKFLKKYNYSQDGAEISFITLGVHYGLPDEEIKEVLSQKSFCDKHALLLIKALKMECEWKEDEKDNPLDKLDRTLRMHYEPSKCGKEQYERLSELINNDDSLSASQIYQLRKAVELKLPEKQILRMYHSGKDPAQMEKTIEYNVMVREVGQKKNVKVTRRAKFINWIKKHKIKVGAIAVALFIIIGIALFLLLW